MKVSSRGLRTPSCLTFRRTGGRNRLYFLSEPGDQSFLHQPHSTNLIKAFLYSSGITFFHPCSFFVHSSSSSSSNSLTSQSTHHSSLIQPEWTHYSLFILVRSLLLLYRSCLSFNLSPQQQSGTQAYCTLTCRQVRARLPTPSGALSSRQASRCGLARWQRWCCCWWWCRWWWCWPPTPSGALHRSRLLGVRWFRNSVTISDKGWVT